jgi:phosphate transport system substrate-binding protein
MAMISSSLEGEREVLRRRRPELPVDQLQSFEVTRTRVAFVVHRSNPIRRAKLDDIAGVLTGRIRSWRELGGADMAIAVVTVQSGGGVPTTVRNQLLGGSAITPARIIEIEAPSHVLTITSQLEAALGITQLGLAHRSPVPELATDGEVEQQLNLVTLGPPDESLSAVIEAARQIAAEKL